MLLHPRCISWFTVSCVFIVAFGAMSRWEYSWKRFYTASLVICLQNNEYPDLVGPLQHTLDCFHFFWMHCFRHMKIEGRSYRMDHVCAKLSVISPVQRSDTEVVYRTSFNVPVSYTINVTFTTFWMQTSPFGCEKNHMQLYDGANRAKYCGVRDQWSNYTTTSTLQLRFTLHGVGSHFHVELTCAVLEIVNGSQKYLMKPPSEIDIYRDHPVDKGFTLEQLLTLWDPAKVYIYI